jgi:hypothetical protein
MDKISLDTYSPIFLGLLSFAIASIYPISGLISWVPRQFDAVVFSTLPVLAYFGFRTFYGLMLGLLERANRKTPSHNWLKALASALVFASGILILSFVPPVGAYLQGIYQDNFAGILELVWASSAPEVEKSFDSFARIFSLLSIISLLCFAGECVLSLVWGGLRHLLRRAVEVSTGRTGKSKVE